MDLINVSTIYGKAGTGKSTFVTKLICKCIENNLDYVVLTATHSSLENIYNICKENGGDMFNDNQRKSFKTIFSFFRIDYKNGTLAGAKNVPPNIFIDEFSLIDKYLFKKIILDLICKAKNIINLVLSGDALQLNAIYTEKQYVSFNKMKKINMLAGGSFNVSPNVMEHVHLSIFGSKFIRKGIKKILTKNLRSENVVSDTLTAIYARDEKFPFNFVDEPEIVGKILNENYIFLSSKYSIIQKIYDRLADQWNDKITIEQSVSYRLGLKRLYLYSGMELIVTITSDEKRSNGDPYYFNGECVTFTGNMEGSNSLKCINKNNEIIYVKRELDSTLSNGEYYFPVTPSNLITIHKSQGRSMNSIIVCIDELFDMCMLYTAITRCRHNLLFFTTCSDRKNKLFESAFIDDFKQLNYILNKIAITDDHKF